MILYFSKSLYPKISLIKAAYNFTDRAYIYLEQNDKDYIVNIKTKDKYESSLDDDFKNEMLVQTARYEIYKQTKEIRKIIIARAMASTVIEKNQADNESDEDIDASKVLKDWFEQDE